MILDALRNAEGELGTAEIVTALLEAGGHGDSARRAVGGRVRGNLAYLERRGNQERQRAHGALADHLTRSGSAEDGLRAPVSGPASEEVGSRSLQPTPHWRIHTRGVPQIVLDLPSG
jgi:hypothetical protein